MATLDSALLEEIAGRGSKPNFLELTANLKATFSAEDELSYRALESIFEHKDAEWDSIQSKLSRVDA